MTPSLHGSFGWRSGPSSRISRAVGSGGWGVAGWVGGGGGLISV